MDSILIFVLLHETHVQAKEGFQPFLEGFGAHILGGLIGGLIGWLGHLVYERYRRKKHHAQFDRDVLEFAQEIRGLVALDNIPPLMKKFVPIASKAHFGTEIPPLKEEYIVPEETTLKCRICERDVKPTTEGRCETCKLGYSTYQRLRENTSEIPST